MVFLKVVNWFLPRICLDILEILPFKNAKTCNSLFSVPRKFQNVLSSGSHEEKELIEIEKHRKDIRIGKKMQAEQSSGIAMPRHIMNNN